MIFSFEFDDSYRSFLNAATILEKYGFRGTFNISLRGVVCERKEDRIRMFPLEDTLTWDEVKYLQEHGHDIASHGVRHSDLLLITTEEMEVELYQSKRIFNSHGINVVSYACAFNNYTPKADKMTTMTYKAIRGRQGVNPLPFSGHVYHSENGNALVEKLPLLKDENTWRVGAWHNTKPDGFEAIVKKVKESGVVVKTVREMIG